MGIHPVRKLELSKLGTVHETVLGHLPRPGKAKAHKHKQFCPGTAWVGGVPRPGGQGSNVYVLCVRSPRNITFSFGYPTGRIGDRGAREIVHVPNAYVPFLAPTRESFEVIFRPCG